MFDRILPATILPRLQLASGAFHCIALLFTTAAWPEGILDVSAFDRCKACHEIRNGDHLIVAGGHNGPNLFGVLGRTAGTLPGYNFSQGLTEAGQAGLVYDLENLTAYVTNPNRFLGEFLGGNARSKMPLGFPDYASAAAEFLERVQFD